MNDTVRSLFSIVRSELYGTEPSAASVTESALESIYGIAHTYGIDQLVGDAVVRRKLLPEDGELYKKYKKSVDVSIYQTTLLDFWTSRVSKCFDDAAIPYVPLKGSGIRKLYPMPFMRSSCDIDVLVKTADLKRAVGELEKLGFRQDSGSSHDISLYLDRRIHVELHYETVEKGKAAAANEVLSHIWEYCENTSGCEYVQNDAMRYFYIVAHAAKHLEGGGCGIKPFIDIAVLNDLPENDAEGRKKLISDGGLDKFEKCAKALSEYWLKDGEPDRTVLLLEELVLSGDCYGGVENKIVIDKAKKSRAGYVMSRAFPPYDYLKYRYPVLQKHKILYPFMIVRRLFGSLSKKNIERTKNELNTVNSDTESEEMKVCSLLNELGLGDDL